MYIIIFIGGFVPGIVLRENEPLDAAIRKFKKVVEKAGLSRELKKREFYEPPSKIKKRCFDTVRKRMLKKIAKDKSMLKKKENYIKSTKNNKNQRNKKMKYKWKMKSFH